MNSQRFGISYIGQMTYQLKGVDEFLPILSPTFDAELQYASKSILQILFGEQVIGTRG